MGDVKSMLKPIEKLARKNTEATEEESSQPPPIPTIDSKVASKNVGRINADDDTLDFVQFDNFVDEEDEEEDEVRRVDPVYAFSFSPSDE